MLLDVMTSLHGYQHRKMIGCSVKSHSVLVVILLPSRIPYFMEHDMDLIGECLVALFPVSACLANLR